MAKALTTFNVTVATAGTRVQVKATSTVARMVAIQGKYTNSGTLFVGDSSVAASNGFALNAREAFSVGEMQLMTADNRIDLSLLYVDTSSSGDIAIIAYIPY